MLVFQIQWSKNSRIGSNPASPSIIKPERNQSPPTIKSRPACKTRQSGNSSRTVRRLSPIDFYGNLRQNLITNAEPAYVDFYLSAINSGDTLNCTHLASKKSPASKWVAPIITSRANNYLLNKCFLSTTPLLTNTARYRATNNSTRQYLTYNFVQG